MFEFVPVDTARYLASVIENPDLSCLRISNYSVSEIKVFNTQMLGKNVNALVSVCIVLLRQKPARGNGRGGGATNTSCYGTACEKNKKKAQSEAVH